MTLTTSADTRTITIYGDDVYIDGLTKGPRGGWTWNGQWLSHPLGVRMRMTPEAAAKITAAAADYAHVPDSSLTGYQLSRLPEADRAGYEYSHSYDVHGIYVKRGSVIPGRTVVNKADVVEVVRVDR
jgi:hypothetical protein